jgi:Transposase IS116/IS110/IS902 family
MTKTTERLTLSTDPDDAESLDAFVRLSRDLKKAAGQLTAGQARYLVDTYYQVQQFRITAAHESRQAVEAQEPTEFLAWVSRVTKRLEGSLQAALKAYAEEQVPGRWAMSIVGIGPVLAAGLLAHIDIEKAKTAGAIWRFAGLDPTVTWNKGEKRPWNASLKVLCWKIGESFVKVKGREGAIYGQLYEHRKALELEKNARGEYGSQAAHMLSAKKWRKETISRAAYEEGKLPQGHVHARAKRWAVKLFLAHYHHVAYEVRFGQPPPMPYVISILGHGDYVGPPNWPMQEP